MLAVVFSITVMILTKQLVMAVDQCPDLQFKSPFQPGESCEGIYSKNLETRDQPGYYWILSREYCGMSYTGSSCEDIYTKYPETHDKSGYYRISNNDWAYCNMTTKTDPDEYYIPQCGSGQWRRIAYINISAGNECPGGWRAATQSGVSFCRVASDNSYSCSSAHFSTNGTSYQKVCGRARGYQKGAPWGFYGRSGVETIDGVYATGLSLTHGSPRQHIWTFVAGYSEVDNDACPCAGGKWPSPSFVGNNYYCESGTVNTPIVSTYYFSDSLWDGTGCSKQSNCCDNPNQPWFHRQLYQPTQDDIEARICTYGAFNKRSTLIDHFELYIQ
ncbi:uncharacterized protein [Dysidea avara]|uniref:uncharacterized protein n=1 Tax=Dysidea avara TaxID=196820 RepID=UPI00332646CB